jgi:hypothetical protein
MVNVLATRKESMKDIMASMERLGLSFTFSSLGAFIGDIVI